MKSILKSLVVVGALGAGAAIVAKKVGTNKLLCHARDAADFVYNKVGDLADALDEEIDRRIAEDALNDALGDISGMEYAKGFDGERASNKPETPTTSEVETATTSEVETPTTSEVETAPADDTVPNDDSSDPTNAESADKPEKNTKNSEVTE